MELVSAAVYPGKSHRIQPCCINLWDAATNARVSRILTIVGVAEAETARFGFLLVVLPEGGHIHPNCST
eukprot:4289546-Ditylum_brightwellii.AAC.1